jgi:hypothetical protein
MTVGVLAVLQLDTVLFLRIRSVGVLNVKRSTPTLGTRKALRN